MGEYSGSAAGSVRKRRPRGMSAESRQKAVLAYGCLAFPDGSLGSASGAGVNIATEGEGEGEGVWTWQADPPGQPVTGGDPRRRRDHDGAQR